MKIVELLLISAGGLLPLLALGKGWQIARERSKDIDRWIARTLELSRRPVEEINAKPTNDILRTEGVPESTWADITTIRLLIQKYIVQDALPALTLPFWLAAAGVASGTLGGALSLYFT